MKSNALNLKKWQTVIGLLTLLVFSSVAGCGKKEEEYRQIQVYKIEGTATVERQGSNMEAYNNMQLQSGDMVETAENSSIQLKLDEDKYILVEPDSKISLQATGNSVDSKTSIYLEKGAIVNQIDNPLSEDSSYQVTTPNSTMAVRGTTFRVEITYDEKGHSYAKVAVFGGEVECNLVFPDGTIAEPVLVKKGTEVLVWGDDVESDYVWSKDTNYEELKESVIDFLGVIIDRGEELSITKEEIEVLKEGLELLEETEEENREEESEQESEETVEDSDATETTEEKKTEEALEEKKNEIEEKAEEKKEEPKQEEPKQEETPPVNPTPPVVTTPGDSSSGNGTVNGGGSTSEGGNSTGGNTSVGDSTGGDTSGGDTSGGDTSEGGTSGGDTSTQIDITINFCLSDGTVFATKKQSVDSSATEISQADITKPLLQPTASGSWDYESKDTIAIETKNVDGTEIKVVTITWQ